MGLRKKLQIWPQLLMKPLIENLTEEEIDSQ